MDQGITRAGRCASLRPDRGSACVGSADAAEIDAATEAPQGEAASVPTGEASVAVAADGKIEVEKAGVQQPADGVCQRHHDDAEGRLLRVVVDSHAVHQ